MVCQHQVYPSLRRTTTRGTRSAITRTRCPHRHSSSSRARSSPRGSTRRARANPMRRTTRAIVQRTAPPSLPLGIGLPIRSATSLRQEIIKRPSFLHHFDTIVMDSDWLGCSSVGTSMPEQWGCSPAQPPTLVTDRFWLSRNGPGPRGLRYTSSQLSLQS